MFFDFSKLNRLPTLPVVAIRLLERFNDPNVALNEIARIVQTDPAISAKLLRAVNSAAYGASRPVSDLNRAVNLLGKKTVTSLVLCFSLAEDSMRRGSYAGLYRSVWLQSVIQAVAAERIAKLCARGLDGEAFTISLLANIGQLAMLKAAPAEYASVVTISQTEGRLIEQVEDEAFGTDSHRLSLALLEYWKLPPRICDCVKHRHDPVSEIRMLPAGELRLLISITRLASVVARYYCSSPRGLQLAQMCDIAADLLNLDAAALGEILEAVQRAVQENAELFETDTSTLGAATDLMAEAMEQLGNLIHSTSEGQGDMQVRSTLLDENGQLRQRIQDLMRQGTIDSLTGVSNRGHFDELFNQHVAFAAAANESVGLLFLDADHFKLVNDQYGHTAGDKVLKRIATLMTDSVREGDVVARYGGEEFVILPRNASVEGLQSLAERIRLMVEADRIVVGDDVIRVTMSVGGALIGPPIGIETANDLLNEADDALYEAKRSGRNKVVIRNHLFRELGEPLQALAAQV